MAKFLKISLIVLLISALPSWGQKKGKKNPVPEPDTVTVNYTDPGMPGPDSLGFTGTLGPVYYYTEGLKKNLLYKDKDEAVALLSKAIELDSTFSPAYFEIANVLAESDSEKALRYSETANRLDTTDIWYRSQLGKLLIFNRDYFKAQKVFEELITLNPKNPGNYNMLAWLYEQTRQPFAAIAVLDKAENTVGLIEDLAKYKRELLVSVGLHDKAIEEGKALVANYPYDYDSYLSLAELYAETRKDSLAIENYNMALGLNPKGIDIIASMNEFYKIKGDEANYLATTKQLFQSNEIPVEMKIQAFNDVTADINFYRRHYYTIKDLAGTLYTRYPDNYSVVELYADNARGGGEMEEALNVYKRFLTDTITDIRPFMDILNMEAYLKRPDSVNKYTALALERFPNDPELYIRQGGILSYLDKDKEAMKAYESALKYARNDSMRSIVHGMIGDEYHLKGNAKKSYANYEKALKLWPDNVVILNNYAYFLSEEEKELDKALEMSSKVMELEPSNPTYMDTYGWVLFKLGRTEEAKKIIQQAVALDSRKSSELFLHYGDILYVLGETYMASVYWQRAQEAGYDSAKIQQRLKLIETK